MTRAAFLLCLATILAAASAEAQPRPSTLAMTCPQARALVTRQGAIVLGTGGQTYDRFVRDRTFCEATEVGKRAFVPTRNSPQCLVGYTCYEPGRGDWFDDF